jgi:NitT/TauT family transport system ATP-binding protein
MTGPAIELQAARRVYAAADPHRSTAALDGVDLTVPAGRFVSVIGPSGCGKSTLLRLAAGLEAPDAGTVAICGRPPVEATRRKLIGFVPQSPALLPWLSIRRNVTLPLRVNRQRGRGASTGSADVGRQRGGGASTGSADVGGASVDVDALLAKAGLAAVAGALPHQLSGGMRQRAAIVRAFALQPGVLLMDEPFSALDEFTRAALQEQLLQLWGELGATVLFVTHNIGEAVRLSDQVVVMGRGRILDTIEVGLPRPRRDELDDPALRACEIRVRDALREAFDEGAA